MLKTPHEECGVFNVFGRKPNAIGKDANLWDNLYQEVLMDYLQKCGALEDYA